MASIVDLVFNKKQTNIISLDKEFKRREPDKDILEKNSKSFDDLLKKKKQRIENIKFPVNKEITKKEKIVEKTQLTEDKKIIKPFIKKDIKNINKLKNFESLQDLFEDIEKNRKDYSKLFPVKKEGMEKNTNLYKPKNDMEAKNFERIEELNNLKITEEKKPLIIKKKQISKNNSNLIIKSNKYLSENDIWCSKCKNYHDQNLHKKPLMINENKIFRNSNIIPNKSDKLKEIKKSISNNQLKIQKQIKNNSFELPNSKILEKQRHLENKIPHSEERIKKNEDDDKTRINKIKQSIQIHNKKIIPVKKKQNSNTLFSREDFEEDDDFIVYDDDNQDYRKYMESINKKYRRRQYTPSCSDEESIMEAGFDEIMEEEDYTAKVGEKEDFIEEMREEMIKKKMKYKY